MADLQTPVAAFLKLAHGQPNSFLLESVEGGAARGRYSIIGMAPDLMWRCVGGRAEVNRNALSAPHAFVADDRPPLDSLRAMIAESQMTLPPGTPPMCGGLFGYPRLRHGPLMERLPAKNADVLGLPEALLMRPTLFAVFDTVRDELTLAAPVRPAPGVTAEQAWAEAQARIADAQAALARPLPRAAPPVALPPPDPVPNMDRAAFEAMVVRMKEYIVAGDIFQAVPSQRFSAPFAPAAVRAVSRAAPHQPGAVPVLPGFRRLRRGRQQPRDPGPPARQHRHHPPAGRHPPPRRHPGRGRRAGGRPAGRPEGARRAPDAARPGPQRRGPGERRGHACASRRASQVERFSHVMHISSNVEGTLAPGLDAVDALVAGFPAGTLTGAPKIRAMEIIEELEPVRRGLYGGCIGYFAADGTMDTCIGLRTAVVKDGVMHVQAGGGVVADSTPAAEYEESRQKARALFRAAEEAVRFAAGPR